MGRVGYYHTPRIEDSAHQLAILHGKTHPSPTALTRAAIDEIPGEDCRREDLNPR